MRVERCVAPRVSRSIADKQMKLAGFLMVSKELAAENSRYINALSGQLTIEWE
jgi:hypothetical protein